MDAGIPKESETIASKRSKRLAEKIGRSGVSGVVFRSWKNNRFTETFAVVILLIVNLYSIYPFFGTSASDAFFSGPVIPILAKAFVILSGHSFSNSVQIINIVFFLGFPISLYLFIRSITDRKLISVLAVSIASLTTYPFAETRISTSLLGVDAAHIASLTIIPIALIGLLNFVKRGGVNNLMIAVVFAALVALTSPFGFLTYAIFAGIISFSELLLGGGRLKLARFLTILIVSGGLTSFWYNPSFFFWMIIGPLGENIRFTVSKLFPITFFTLPLLGAFGYLMFDRKPTLQPLFIASFFSITYAIISLAGGGIFPSHPSRYVPEFGVSMSLILSIVIVKLSDFIKLDERISLAKTTRSVFSNTFLVLVFFLLGFSIVSERSKFEIEKKDVLGVWDEVEKGEIWESREKFSGGHSVWGYSVTGLTIIGLGVLVRNSKKRM